MVIIDSERGVPTTSLNRCVEFYTEVLGFTKTSETQGRCTVALGPNEVVFRSGHIEEVRSLCEIGFSLNFRITGIREYYDRVRANDRVVFQQELEFMQPGVSQFVLVDCNGYPIGFASDGAVA